jgi:4'-phosphopantetheinyl transferase
MPVVTCNSRGTIHWAHGAVAAFSIGNDVAVWRLQISANLNHIDLLAAVLDAEEQKRGLSYGLGYDRQRFVLSHGLLRLLLGKYLRIEPKDIVFARGENNKPFVNNAGATGIHFNIAHSGDWILIAISGSNVGVDVEYIDEHFNYTEVLPMCFNFDDISFIQNSENAKAAFYLYWTRKEALIKATGRGIDNELSAIPCLNGEYNVAPNILSSTQNWRVSSFEVAGNYIVAIACNPGTEHLLFHEAKDVFSF